MASDTSQHGFRSSTPAERFTVSVLRHFPPLPIIWYSCMKFHSDISKLIRMQTKGNSVSLQAAAGADGLPWITATIHTHGILSALHDTAACACCIHKAGSECPNKYLKQALPGCAWNCKNPSPADAVGQACAALDACFRTQPSTPPLDVHHTPHPDPTSVCPQCT